MAHLNRIAVDPLQQGQGIGAVLLKHALVSLWRQGVETVSLNTQRSNRRSRRLYDRFGFQASGDSATVWVLRL
jgi:ribosomal protein S18 acetylase RimI-like enzyme